MNNLWSYSFFQTDQAIHVKQSVHRDNSWSSRWKPFLGHDGPCNQFHHFNQNHVVSISVLRRLDGYVSKPRHPVVNTQIVLANTRIKAGCSSMFIPSKNGIIGFDFFKNLSPVGDILGLNYTRLGKPWLALSLPRARQSPDMLATWMVQGPCKVEAPIQVLNGSPGHHRWFGVPPFYETPFRKKNNFHPAQKYHWDSVTRPNNVRSSKRI